MYTGKEKKGGGEQKKKQREKVRRGIESTSESEKLVHGAVICNHDNERGHLVL